MYIYIYKINLTNELISTQNSKDTKSKSSLDKTPEDDDRSRGVTRNFSGQKSFFGIRAL